MKTRSGFTIVELLIVIVVIAILATISIVTYAGIQERANIAAGKSFDAQMRRSLSIEAIAAFNFDEGSGTTATDASGNGNNATVTGSWTSGMEGGGALQANNNGTGARTTSSIYFGSDSFTISAWVNSSDTDGAQSRVFGKTFASDVSSYFYLNFGNGRPRIEARDSSGAYWSTGSGTTNISGKWAHVATVVNREKSKAFVYVNGKQESQTSTIASAGVFGDSSSTGSFLIGYQTSSATLSLDGIIDDVYIYKSALSASNLQQIYADGSYRLRNPAPSLSQFATIPLPAYTGTNE